MSEKMSHIYQCDNCKKEVDVGFKGFPNEWIKVKLETTSGMCIYHSIQLCGECGIGSDGDKRTSTMCKFFKIFKTGQVLK